MVGHVWEGGACVGGWGMCGRVGHVWEGGACVGGWGMCGRVGRVWVNPKTIVPPWFQICMPFFTVVLLNEMDNFTIHLYVPYFIRFIQYTLLNN